MKIILIADLILHKIRMMIGPVGRLDVLTSSKLTLMALSRMH